MNTLFERLSITGRYLFSHLSVLDVLLLFIAVWFLFRYQGRVYAAFLSMTVVFIAAPTLLGRAETVVNSWQTVLSSFYSVFGYNWDYALFDLLLNMVLFIPLGCVLAVKYTQRRVILIGFLVSLSVELLQLLFSIGLFELADLITNTIGAALGAVIVGAIIQRRYSK